MKVITLDGESYNLVIKSSNKANRSKLHQELVDVFTKLYPNVNLYEDVSIKIKRRKTLYLDCYIPLFKTAIEINGKQHSQYTNFFHKDKYSFYTKQKLNDNLKREWCELNNLDLIELEYDNRKQWRSILCSKFGEP